MDKNSMLYWFPKIAELLIPKPITFFTTKGAGWDKTGDYLTWSKRTQKEIGSAIRSFGLPVFLRTDLMSCKHDWKNTCFLTDIKKLENHLLALAEGSYSCDIMGRPVNAFVVRQYIQMKNLFTAFEGNMPVNPEIRFFIKGGQVLCWHWYWIEEAIEETVQFFPPSVPDWKELLNKTIEEFYPKHLEDLGTQAQLVADVFKNDDSFSVDFCQAQDGTWYLIDMALAEESWHPEDCEAFTHNPNRKR